MKKQNDLQWFLIKKFIEILAVVGVVEYLLTFLVNRFVLPNVLLYQINLEVEESKNNISSLEDDIKTKESEIRIIEESTKELNEKIKKLEEKKKNFK